MCMPLKATQLVYQSLLCHVLTGCWVSYKSLSKPWTAHLSLTGRCAITWTKSHTILLDLYPGCGMHHGSDKHLAYGDGTNIDSCKVMTITVDYGMAIIALNRLYSMLSYQPTPTNALFILYGRHANSRGTSALHAPYLHQEWASRHFGPRLLVGFQYENTCHVGCPKISSSQS
jgi:hypothetical protein